MLRHSVKTLKLFLENPSMSSSPDNQPNFFVCCFHMWLTAPWAHPRFNELSCRAPVYKTAIPASCWSSSWSPWGGGFTSQLLPLQFPLSLWDQFAPGKGKLIAMNPFGGLRKEGKGQGCSFLIFLWGLLTVNALYKKAVEMSLGGWGGAVHQQSNVCAGAREWLLF